MFLCICQKVKRKVWDPVLISGAVLACQAQDVDSGRKKKPFMWYECKRLTLFYNGSVASKISTYGRVLMFSCLHLILLSHYMSDSDIQSFLVFLRE